jgi:hypothetical protein
MFKVLTFGFRYWKFLLLNVEGSYVYTYMLKVFALRCWRFWLLLLDVESLWFLVFCLFAYIKKNDVKIYFILLRSWLYKFTLIYNDEKFMKG